MAKEQERKFLIDTEQFKHFLSAGFPDGEELVGSKYIRQAYLGDSGLWKAFVKIREQDPFLVVKSEALSKEFNFSFADKTEDALQLIMHPATAFTDNGLVEISLSHWALRIRLFESGAGEICLKEKISGEVRGECEVDVDPDTAEYLFNSVEKKIDKMRYLVMKSGFKWEVDLFEGRNKGLGVAELETEIKNYPLLTSVLK